MPFLSLAKTFIAFVALCCSGFAPTEAHAVDGCKILLCMAGNWRNISECEPDVRRALRDVASGRGWPRCEMGGSAGAAGSGSSHTGLAVSDCPVQYRFVEGYDFHDRPVYACAYTSVVSVSVDGQPWSRTYVNLVGDSVTEWFPAARAALGGSPNPPDDQFDRDYAAWLATQVAP